MIVTRFAPSPNGPLHLGHAYSAIVAHDLAREAGGRFLLRIEDIDGARSRPGLADEFRRDLEWLGLEWQDVPAQSTRVDEYEIAAATLLAAGLIFPCCCTRAEIASSAGTKGPAGLIYAGTCKHAQIEAGEPVAWRLDVEEARSRTGPLVWTDQLAGEQQARPELLGDVVLIRKDPSTPASYHLAATLDDAADGVTLVTRGADLFPATHIHRLLQDLLGLPVPRWHHHGLLLDADGTKLAKSRKSGEAGFGLAQRRLAGADGRALANALRTGQMPGGISLARTLHEAS